MIAGIGMDIVKTERIKLLLDKHGKTFLRKILADDELAALETDSLSPEKAAGKWAAKEAVAKALGCGFGSCCAVTDIHILHDGKGAPSVQLSGAASEYSQTLHISHIFVSITHEKEYAAAVAVLEKLP